MPSQNKQDVLQDEIPDDCRPRFGSGFQKTLTCELNESNCPSHQEAVSLFSESRESALCPGKEHRKLLSAAKLPSVIAAAVPKADICPPLTFLLRHIRRPQTYIAA